MAVRPFPACITIYDSSCRCCCVDKLQPHLMGKMDKNIKVGYMNTCRYRCLHHALTVALAGFSPPGPSVSTSPALPLLVRYSCCLSDAPSFFSPSCCLHESSAIVPFGLHAIQLPCYPMIVIIVSMAHMVL